MMAAIGGILSVVGFARLFARPAFLPKRKAPQSAPTISVVVPARDEAENLGRLLPSLNGQTLMPKEVLVVDDQSSDSTADVARSFGARVVDGVTPPEGWYGKPWACRQGVEVASGEVLLFLDADVELEEDALARMAAHAVDHPAAVISVCPWHRIEKVYEEFSVFFNLLMTGGIGAFTRRGWAAKGVGLFGQLMWISRDLYDEIGGHGRVRNRVLENFHLSRDFESMGVERHCFLGRGAVSMRMFPGGFDELVASWAKGFAGGAGLVAKVPLILSSLGLTGLMVLMMCGLSSPFGDAKSLAVLVGIWLVVAVILFRWMRMVGKFSLLNALLFPVSLMFYQSLFARSLLQQKRGRTVKWKGRDVA
ncbi:glycosyltransferase [Haloferula sp.]|uniref:glycosyltransferase n=1 Tax=Haloferula sp. TaxID=2497595 RepID=UPI00329E88FE